MSRQARGGPKTPTRETIGLSEDDVSATSRGEGVKARGGGGGGGKRGRVRVRRGQGACGL